MNELTNEELRLEIAKAKGWKNIFYYDGPDITTWMGLDPDQHYSGQFALPDWPIDITAAWELVEEMAKMENFYIENGWRCAVDNFSRTIIEVSDTAPRAICLAWLAWMEAKK